MAEDEQLHFVNWGERKLSQGGFISPEEEVGFRLISANPAWRNATIHPHSERGWCYGLKFLLQKEAQPY